MFYLLSLITGILECGWIAFGVMRFMPLWQILCYPLAYHIGNLFPKPFSLSGRCLRVMCVLSVLTGSLTFAKQLSESDAFVLTCISLFLLSAIIQSVRSKLKSDGNRLFKRIFRIGGFALAPLAAIFPSAILTIASVIALFAIKDHQSSFSIGKLTWQNGFSAVMILHQLHYFFYAHTILATLCILLSNDFFFGGIVCAAFLFCGTWVTYMSVEPILSKLTSKILPVFYLGHISISFLLLIMSNVTIKPIFILLWLITGFGGGVVYTISAEAKSVGYFNKDSMIISENISHTLGLIFAVIIAAVFGDKSPQLMLIFGSSSAMFAVITMFFVTRKENHHEIIHNKG